MQLQVIQNKIYEIREQKVMLDFDLAELYEIETKYLKRAVKRNSSRFPGDFMFELTKDEFQSLRFQIGTSNRGGTRYTPYAFTENGVAMLSSVLNSDKAINVNIAIMRAFTQLRQYALTYTELARQIADLEENTGKQFADVYKALRLLMEDKNNRGKWEERERIGFMKE